MKTCAFTGHRPQHLPFGMNENDERCTDLKETLKEQIINLIETEDVTHFITGMALGIDLYAAELVLDLKARYPSITLESAIPCETQAVKWLAAQRERYYDIVRNGYYTLPGMISEVFEQLTEQDVKDGALYVPIMDTEMQRNTLMRQNPYWLARW